MPVYRAFTGDRRRLLCAAIVMAMAWPAIAHPVRAQNNVAPRKMPSSHVQKGATDSPRISLSPKFSPGQVFRYAMEFETTTATRRSGLAADPQGPSSLEVIWDATIRLEVLPPDPATIGATADPTSGKTPGGFRLRTTYEKSTANVRSDTFDPTAAETEEQYKKLAGKVVEFTLDASGKVTSVSGLEGIVEGEKAAHASRDWISHLDAGSGAPPGGVVVGETWTSEQSADSLPIAGMAWRTDSQYLRNEPCHPANPDVPSSAATADSPTPSDTSESCAVILTHLNLIRPKSVHNQTPEEYRKNGVQTAGTWSGSAQNLVYVSLRTGAVVSVSQTGSEDMDVTLMTNQNTSLRYSGTILSRSQVELIGDGVPSK
jgi:hypothetical protein